jgi:hypothetical protein
VVKLDNMHTETNSITVTPPKLIASLAAGFNTVANHIYLIIFPIVLDLFLWFGPRLRIKTLSEPFIAEFNRVMVESGSANSAEVVRLGKEFWETVLNHFNLFSVLRTFPVGITSLFSSSSPLASPLGEVGQFEIPSFLSFVGFGLLLMVAGLAAGSFYFHEVARCSSEDHPQFSLQQMTWQYIQTLLLTVSLLVVLLLFTIPTLLTLSVILMFSPGMAQIALFIFSLLMLWLLLPLVFAPHGIFANRQNMLSSIQTSIHLVRYYLPGTGLFLLTVLLFSQGMDVIWRVPPETSWMALVGVLGHAFITTALLSASFVYYSGGIRWMKENLKRLSSKKIKV